MEVLNASQVIDFQGFVVLLFLNKYKMISFRIYFNFAIFQVYATYIAIAIFALSFY